MKKKKMSVNDDFKIDESQFEIDQKQYEIGEESVRKTKEIEATEEVAIDPNKETINFPWYIVIIMGILMILIIACIIVIKVLER